MEDVIQEPFLTTIVDAVMPIFEKLLKVINTQLKQVI